MSRNLLDQETSPYLRQHKDNPVHWRPWGEQAMEEARGANKPILLSVGYAACHWCHVMAHESFEDAQVAAVMNALFVNVKVDREERPDVDAVYQSALSMLGEQGGWPLTMFLTPQGRPFWGGTYFPPTPRFGRPAFPDVLRQIAHVFHNDPERVTKNVDALTEGLRKLATPPDGQGVTDGLLDEVASAGLRLIDPIRGGTAGAPKFPQPVLFRFLWRAYKRSGAAMFRDAVTLTLDAMSRGGIYDHLGGGFARYATDTAWLVPHFEKMLYDNALLVDLMTEVWQDTRSPLYAARVEQTLGWARRELSVPSPHDDTFAFASAFDADSEGEEGRYYVWSKDEIDAILGEDAEVFCAHYDVTRGGNWEGRTILNRSQSPRPASADVERTLAGARERLLAARGRRVPPGRDDKVLADWNGLMISALVHASVAFDRPAWLDEARRVFRFVVRHMQRGDRLLHVWCDGSARHPAVLEDYANMARAALSLFELTSEKAYLDQACRWVDIADRHYWDAEGHGYFQSADDTTDLITRPKVVADNAVPSGNGTMVEVLARLFHLTGRGAYRDRAETLLKVFSSDNAQYLLSIPGLLAGYEVLHHALQVVIIGEEDDPAREAMTAAVFSVGAPLKVLTVTSAPAGLPEGHPAFGKRSLNGRATAYVCADFRCGPPVTDPSDLRRALVAV
jgi:uncharacterized protein YyaL (SSP411 family)